MVRGIVARMGENVRLFGCSTVRQFWNDRTAERSNGRTLFA